MDKSVLSIIQICMHRQESLYEGEGYLRQVVVDLAMWTKGPIKTNKASIGLPVTKPSKGGGWDNFIATGMQYSLIPYTEKKQFRETTHFDGQYQSTCVIK